MSTICDLRARQIGGSPALAADCADINITSQTDAAGQPKGDGAEIIMFPKFSTRTLKRPRKRLALRARARAKF